MKKPIPIVKSALTFAKITLLQILVVVCTAGFTMASAADSVSQGILDKTLSISADNKKLGDVLTSIENLTHVRFSFNPKAIPIQVRVSVNLTDAKLKDVLTELLGPLKISYEASGDFVILNPPLTTGSMNIKHPPVATPSDEKALAVSGTVVDGDNLPLPGANVIEKGTTNGTTTDADGRYSLTVSEENVVLVFSFIGYTTQEIAVGGRAIIDVELQEDLQKLSEVVVVGYGSQEKVNITGAVDHVDSKVFKDIPVSNLSRSLQGQIPGLNIVFNSGRPIDNPSYNIRGLTSIGAGGSALILIDGVEGDPSTLNPKDVESVSVLKDAASCAIYGSRGVFGVVLITTKNPEKESQITYSAVRSINFRTAERDVVDNPYIWAKMYRENYTARYGYTLLPTSIRNVGIDFSDAYLEELKYRYHDNPNHGRPDVEVDPATGKYLYYGNTDWWKELYVPNFSSMEHTLSASGGGDKSSYSISGRYFAQDGLYQIRSDEFRTYDVRTKGTVRPLDWLSITGNLHLSSRRYDDPFRGTNIWSQMRQWGHATRMAVVYNPDGSFTRNATESVGVLHSENNSAYHRNQMVANISFDADIVKDALSLKGFFTYRNNVDETKTKVVPIPYSETPGVMTETGVISSLANDKTTLNYYSYNLYADFSRDFGNHSLNIMGGTNIEISQTRSLNIFRSGLIIKELEDFNLATGTNFRIVGGGNDWANAGVFSRINYRYKEKYLLEVNARYDGSSKFPTNKQYAFFPSVSVGWRLTEESFLENSRTWLDNLKTRFSYGSLGNSQIAPYLFVEQIRGAQSLNIIQGERPTVLRNPLVLPDDFTWETSTTFDIGLDVDLFQYKLGVVFDWYQRTTTDMITKAMTLPNVFGAVEPRGNYADMVTKGFEFSLRWNDQIKTASKPINYGVRLTLADDVSTITRYNNPNGDLVMGTENRVVDYYEGMRVGDLWGFVTEGLFVDEEDVQSHADQTAIGADVAGNYFLPGDLKFKDLNGDGVIDKGSRTLNDHGDWTIIGNASPRFTYGATLNGEYGSFSISAFFQGVGKRDWYPPGHQNSFYGQYGVWYSEIPKHTLENAYTLDNPDPNAYWFRYKPSMFNGESQGQNQTRYMQNSAYIRLKNLTVAYSIPQQVVERLKIKSLRFYFTGQNIWTYTPVFKITRDIDPEQMDGGSGHYYPMLKSYSLGVNVSF